MKDLSIVSEIKAAIARAREAAVPDHPRVDAGSMFQNIQFELRTAMRHLSDGERFETQLQTILDIATPYCRTAAAGRAFNDSDLLGAISRFEEALIAAAPKKPAG